MSMRLPLQHNTLKMLSYLLCLAIIVLLIPASGVAGNLDDFEKDTQRTRGKEARDSSGDENEDPLGSCIGDVVGDITINCLGDFLSSLFTTTIVEGSSASMERVHPDDEEKKLSRPEAKPTKGIKPHQLGEALLPFIRIDGSYQDVKSDISAFDYRAEIGYGPLGFQVRQTQYQESNPHDELRITQIHSLLRLSFDHRVEVDLGLGTFTINGDDQQKRFSFTSPIFIYPKEFIGIEFRPTLNEGSVNDYDLGMALSLPYISLRMGYRWVVSIHESLDGPYLGFSFRL
jgi:hypothetical protein